MKQDSERSILKVMLFFIKEIGKCEFWWQSIHLKEQFLPDVQEMRLKKGLV